MSEARRIRDFMLRATKEQTSLVTRGLALRVLSGVVLKTPVDTGRARGNWQTNVGRGTREEIDVEDKGGNSTVAKGLAAIGKQKGFQQISLDNNVPYIGRLEDGSSRQSPPGNMVAGTLASLGLSPGRES